MTRAILLGKIDAVLEKIADHHPGGFGYQLYCQPDLEGHLWLSLAKLPGWRHRGVDRFALVGIT
jgi:hypothetical protein